MQSTLNRSVVTTLLAAGLLAATLFLLRASHASGQYNHVHMADTAIARIQDGELSQILEDPDRRELFKFSALFPDTYFYDKEAADGGAQSAGIVHSPAFFDEYARAIREECFAEPVGDLLGNSCDHRPDISCSFPFTPLGCKVQGSNLCSETLTPCTPFAGDCPGLGNTCLDRGVCSADYQTPCAQGALPSNCPGLLNTCQDDYGFCLPNRNNLSNKCERVITHFMGALAHLVSDANADKFFQHSVGEREDCPPLGGDDAQTYTDQDMDAWLGRNATISGQASPLHDILPSSEIHGLFAVEVTFLRQVLENVPVPRSGEVGGLLDKQWFSMMHKTTSDGRTFNGFGCTKRTDIECLPFSSEQSCKVEADGDFDGVCTEDYTTQCRRGRIPSDCPGLFNTCVDDYGRCSADVARRRPEVENCQWAIDGDHWYNQGGGTVDTAHEIAKMLDQSWQYMRNGKELRFRMVGKGGKDLHLCVGTADGPDCLQEKASQISGADSNGGSDTQPGGGTLSGWSSNRKVLGLWPFKGEGTVGFVLEGGDLETRARPAFECPDSDRVDIGDNKLLDLNLSAVEQTDTERFTDTLFTAFITDLKVQVRTELTSCSENNRYLVKAVRFESATQPTADAGPDQVLECTSPTGALAMLDGTGSDDPDGDPLTFSWTAPGIVFDDPTSPTPSAIFPKATTTATLEVSDGTEFDTDSVEIDVVDTFPPSLMCPGDLLIECNTAGGVDRADPTIMAFLGGARSTDACDDAPVLLNDAPDFFGLGDTPVTFTATDADGNIGQCSALVTVQDTIAPTVSASLHPDRLWPPNHKLIDISAQVELSDVCDPTSTFTLTDVSSSEPDDATGSGKGSGDGHTVGDIAGVELGTPDTSFQLRAERAGGQGGRMYTATYSARDASGNSSSISAEVRVSDRSRP